MKPLLKLPDLQIDGMLQHPLSTGVPPNWAFHVGGPKGFGHEDAVCYDPDCFTRLIPDRIRNKLLVGTK